MSPAGMLMGKRKGKGGRPSKDEGDAGTGGVRVYADVREMLGWIVFIKKVKMAAYLDELIREQVETDFEEITPAVEEYKRADATAKKFRDEKPG